MFQVCNDNNGIGRPHGQIPAEDLKDLTVHLNNGAFEQYMIMGRNGGKRQAFMKYVYNMSLSRRLDRCDRVIQVESGDSVGGNVEYVTMKITFVTRKFRNG